MSKQVCVIGLGKFGSHLARTLVSMGCEVLVIDLNETRVNGIRDDVHRAVIGDARKQEMLETVLTDEIDEVVICLGERQMEASIICALNLKRIEMKSIRSTAINEDHAQILAAVGVDEIVFPERNAAERLARLVTNPDIRDMFPLGEDYRIIEVNAPAGTHGKTLGALELRGSFDILILAIREQHEEHFHFLPKANTEIREGQVLMVLGRELDLARFSNYA